MSRNARTTIITARAAEAERDKYGIQMVTIGALFGRQEEGHCGGCGHLQRVGDRAVLIRYEGDEMELVCSQRCARGVISDLVDRTLARRYPG